MAADASENTGTLLFGGWAHPLEDSPWQAMWALGPSREWVELVSDPAPEPGDVFGFDTGSGRAVFLEVEGGTWAFDPSSRSWEERLAEAPFAHGARMVYDSESDRLISFGGDNFGPLSDMTSTYDYEANTWTDMQPGESPSPRTYFAMAYDEAADRTIVFGGSDGSSDLGDTWVYDYNSNTWLELSPGSAPGPRVYAAMAHDAGTRTTVLFGGVAGAGEEPLGDTWVFDSGTGTWTELNVAGPSPRGWHVMAADAETGTIVLQGGGASRDECTAQTWIFDPAQNTWSELP